MLKIGLQIRLWRAPGVQLVAIGAVGLDGRDCWAYGGFLALWTPFMAITDDTLEKLAT